MLKHLMELCKVEIKRWPRSVACTHSMGLEATCRQCTRWQVCGQGGGGYAVCQTTNKVTECYQHTYRQVMDEDVSPRGAAEESALAMQLWRSGVGDQ